MTPIQAFEYITNLDVENGSICIKDIKQYQECCDIVEKAIDILEILKPRLHLKDSKLKNAHFGIDEKGLIVCKNVEETDVFFVESSCIVLENGEQYKLLKEWLEK